MGRGAHKAFSLCAIMFWFFSSRQPHTPTSTAFTADWGASNNNNYNERIVNRESVTDVY